MRGLGELVRRTDAAAFPASGSPIGTPSAHDGLISIDCNGLAKVVVVGVPM